MDITYEKLEQLVEAMGEGAELRVWKDGRISIYTNRIKPEAYPKDLPLPIDTEDRSGQGMTFDAAKAYLLETKPFIIFGNALKGEWIEGLYFVMSRKDKDSDIFLVLAEYDPNTGQWKICSEYDFHHMNPKKTNRTHMDWIVETLGIEMEPMPLIPPDKTKDDPVIKSLREELDKVNGDYTPPETKADPDALNLGKGIII